MKVLVVSHSYLEPENQKNILALSALCAARCILPRRGSVLLFHDYAFKTSAAMTGAFFAYRTVALTEAQYVYASATMGLRRFKPDVINVEYNPWSLIFFQILIYRVVYSPKSRIVCTVKKNTFRGGAGIRGRIKRAVACFSLRWVDYIIAASQMAADLYTREFSVPATKIAVCHHLGVDVSLFRPSAKEPAVSSGTEETIVIGYCGRWDRDKGIEDLVEAMRLVNQSETQATVLRLMGCGAYGGFLDDYLRNMSQELEWLELLPPVPHAEVVKFLHTLDVFVLPSRVLDDHQEHDAHALLEAMACGVACIGTKSGIIPELLGNGEGFLVSPQNAQDLSEALRILIHDPKTRGLLASRGRKRALDAFALDVVAKKKSTILRGAINED